MRNRGSSLVLGLVAAFVFGGCTPEIREYASREWYNIKAYDFTLIADAIGLTEAFPDNKRKAEIQDSTMCAHEDNEKREVTINGVEDTYYYRRCTLHPYPEVEPNRFDNDSMAVSQDVNTPPIYDRDIYDDEVYN